MQGAGRMGGHQLGSFFHKAHVWSSHCPQDIQEAHRVLFFVAGGRHDCRLLGELTGGWFPRCRMEMGKMVIPATVLHPYL